MRTPRKDDHFWRRKIVNRIDLNEKINKPLIALEDRFYTDESQYTEKEGLIKSLFNGLKKGLYVAYHPDSLEVALSYDDVLKRIQDNEGSLVGDGDDLEGLEGEGEGFEESGFDEGFEDEGFEEEEWGFEDDSEFAEEFDDMSGEGDAGAGDPAEMGEFDTGPYENVIHFVEDRIFDKTVSDMVYNIEFIEIIWTDPGETLPEKRLCVFRYEDILETLEGTQWKNRYNDAEYRSMKEIFDMRLFHSYILNVSGNGVNSLDEAEHRREQLVEFEHHLWSY